MAQAVSRRRGPGFNTGSVHVGFVVKKVALGQGFPRVLRFLPRQFHSTGASLLGKGQKKIIIIIIIVIFITGLHKKPQGCSASVASAEGPFSTKKKCQTTRCHDAEGCSHLHRHDSDTSVTSRVFFCDWRFVDKRDHNPAAQHWNVSTRKCYLHCEHAPYGRKKASLQLGWRVFRRVREICKKWLLVSSHVSLHPHGTTDFRETWCLTSFWKHAKIQVSLKSDKNNGYFTWRPMYF
jgi:hypothetical protein